MRLSHGRFLLLSVLAVAASGAKCGGLGPSDHRVPGSPVGASGERGDSNLEATPSTRMPDQGPASVESSDEMRSPAPKEVP